MGVEPANVGGADRFDWRRSALIAAVVFGTALAVRLVCFTGLIASDDLGYAAFASQIATGTYDLYPHHYAIRYGVLVPVAGLFRLFGMHEWTMVVLPLLGSSLGAGMTALIAARVANAPTAWTAGLLAATFPVDVRFASILVPEPMLQPILLAGALVFLVARSRDSAVFGLLCGIVFGLAYLTKEPGVFVAVALWCVALVQRRWRLVLSVPAGVALVVAGELLWYWSQSGDLAFRFHAMRSHNLSPMAVSANGNLSYRLLKAYPKMMLVPNLHFGLHSVVTLALAALALLSWRSHKSVVVLLVTWAVVPFLYLNFGTSSLERFWALPLSPRYISIVYPPLFILAGMFLDNQARARPWTRSLAAATVVILAVVGVGCARVTRGTGWRTEHVARIKAIAVTARSDDVQICEFGGADRDRWRQILQIVAPDTMGCASPKLLAMIPDSDGAPMTAPLEGAPR